MKSLKTNLKNNKTKTNSKFDCYGNHIDNSPRDPLIPGDIVEYIDTITNPNPKDRRKTIQVILTGMWDGEKVQFNDREKTIVRNPNWLIKVKN